MIKPDVEDFGQYLRFHSSGEVKARAGLDAASERKALQTIAVLGLDDRSLRGSRRAAVAGYLSMVDELIDWPADERREYLEEELAEARGLPYATAIVHLLEYG